MAEKKEKKIVSAKTGETVSQATIAADRKKKKAEPVPQSTTGLRVGAIVLWVVALGFEVLALLLIVTAFLVDGSFNPFLYFRF